MTNCTGCPAALNASITALPIPPAGIVILDDDHPVPGRSPHRHKRLAVHRLHRVHVHHPSAGHRRRFRRSAAARQLCRSPRRQPASPGRWASSERPSLRLPGTISLPIQHRVRAASRAHIHDPGCWAISLHQGGGADASARVQDVGPLHRPHHRQILQGHCDGPSAPISTPAWRPAQPNVRGRNGRHPDEARRRG